MFGASPLKHREHRAAAHVAREPHRREPDRRRAGVALEKLSPMTRLENIVSFEPWSSVGMLTPGLPS